MNMPSLGTQLEQIVVADLPGRLVPGVHASNLVGLVVANGQASSTVMRSPEANSGKGREEAGIQGDGDVKVCFRDDLLV